MPARSVNRPTGELRQGPEEVFWYALVGEGRIVRFCFFFLLAEKLDGEQDFTWSEAFLPVWVVLGVLLFAMLSASLPFNSDDEDEVVRAVTAGDFAFAPKASWKKVTPQAVDVVSRLLRVRPEARATLAELRAHAWIRALVDAPPTAAAPVTRRASFGNLLSRRASR